MVGCGDVGQLHLQSFRKHPDVEIAGVADLRPELRQRVAQAHGGLPIYASHHELIADDGIDAVIVVTRRQATSAVVRDCLAAGKHVFSEKPMAKTVAAATELVSLARARGVTYVVGFQKRHDPAAAIFRTALERRRETGDLGALLLARVWNHTGKDRVPDNTRIMTQEPRPVGLTLDAQQPDWLPQQYWDSYDRFVNVYSHDMDVLNFFFDETPLVLSAHLSRFNGQAVVLNYRDFSAICEFSLSEILAWDRRAEWDEGIELVFESGRLGLKFAPPLYLNRCAEAWLIPPSGETEILHDGKLADSLFDRQAADFVRCAIEGRESVASGAACLADMAMVESIWRKFAV